VEIQSATAPEDSDGYQTCRLQRRSLYAHLAGALTAKARGDPVPILA
jgi:hypothetical protein